MIFLDNVITVGFSHENRRTLSALSDIQAGHWIRLPMARVWPKLVLLDQLKILYFFTHHKRAQLLENESIFLLALSRLSWDTGLQ